MLKLIMILLVLPVFAKEPELPKEVTWELMVAKGEDLSKGKKTKVGETTVEIPLEGSEWKCKVIPDPEGKKARTAIGCTFNKEIVVLPAVCVPKVMQIFIMNIYSNGVPYSLALSCSTPEEKKKK